MYSAEARARRRCRGRRRDGEPCHAWALWDDPRQLCVNHAGRNHTGPHPKVRAWLTNSGKTRYAPCTCAAYCWPHRPGGGVCEWPNLSPRWRCTTPAGERAYGIRIRRPRGR